MQKKKEIYFLAVGVALLPALWAVLTKLLGIECSWIALVTAGLFTAAGNECKNAKKMSLGLLAGVLWGNLAFFFPRIWGQQRNGSVTLFIVLFALGGTAVILSEAVLKGKTYLPAWLLSFALTLGTLGDRGTFEQNLKIIVSMLAGIYYIGIGVNKFVQIMEKGQK